MDCDHIIYGDDSNICPLCAIKSDTIQPISKIHHKNFGIICKCKIGHLFVYDGGECQICAIITKFDKKCKLKWLAGVYVSAITMLRFECGNLCINRWYKPDTEEKLYIECKKQIIINGLHLQDKHIFDCTNHHKWEEKTIAPLVTLNAVEFYFGAQFTDLFSTKLHVTGYNNFLRLAIVHTTQVNNVDDLAQVCKETSITLIVVTDTFLHGIYKQVALQLEDIGLLRPDHTIASAIRFLKNFKNQVYPTTNVPRHLA